MAKKVTTSNKMAKMIVAEPQHLAAGTMQNLMEKIRIDDGDGSLVPGVQGFVESISEANQAMQRGDLSHLESVLYAQVETLNTMFHSALYRANTSEYINQYKQYQDCAFKAQNQCRRTVMAIAEMKSPKKATFIRQQNNAVNQQINNSDSENELMEAQHGERLDRGASKKAIGADTFMGAMEESDRAKNSSREKAVIEK